MVTPNAELDALYTQIPDIECRGKCQESCGPIGASPAEHARLRAAGHPIPDIRHGGPLVPACPALTFLGACAVYPIRPLICRLWGAVEAMACPHGCRPAGGWLPDATARALIAAAEGVPARRGSGTVTR